MKVILPIPNVNIVFVLKSGAQITLSVNQEYAKSITEAWHTDKMPDKIRTTQSSILTRDICAIYWFAPVRSLAEKQFVLWKRQHDAYMRSLKKGDEWKSDD